MYIAAKVVTGSQLHGLATENSDVDTATVVISPARELMSPFRVVKPRVNQSENNDTVTYEYSQFIKLVTQGNASILEVAFSDHEDNETSSMWELFVYYRDSFMNKDHIYNAHKGYAHSQLAHVFKDGVESARGRKAACAYIRVLSQGAEILSTGNIRYPLSRELAEIIYPIKNGNYAPSSAQFQELALPFEQELTRAYENSQLPTEIDYAVAEYLIEQAYLSPAVMTVGE